MRTRHIFTLFALLCTLFYNGTLLAQCPSTVDALTSASPICAGDTISLTAILDQGAADFVWTSSSGNVLNNPGSVILNNSNCTPGTLTYYVVATCTSDPNIILEDSVSVTVYPSDPSQYVSSTLNSIPGGCELVLEFAGTCGNYLSSTPQTFNVGDNGIATMTVTISDPGQCLAPTFDVDIPYDCLPGPCPTSVDASLAQASICSGQSTQITANVDMGMATYTWYRANGTVLTTNQTTNLTLNNLFCAPGVLMYTVEAVCAFDPSIVVTDSIEITVYPNDIMSFLTPVENECTATLDIDPSCLSSVIVTDQNFNPGESGTADILVQYPTNSCIADFTVPVNYQCDICPSSVTIDPSSFQVCSNTPFSLAANFDMGDATLQWFNFVGNPISNPNNIVVTNSNCQPMNQTFSVQATCNSDPSIVLTDDVVISIFPSDVSSFVTPVNGGCTPSVQISAACGSFISADPPQTFNPGTSGTTMININANTPNPCISDFSVSVSYDCPAIICPSSLTASSDLAAVCDAESINLIASVDIGDATYTWVDDTGASVSTSPTLFNSGCTVMTNTFTVTAVCDDDASVTFTESVSVDVYPSDVTSFFTAVPGACTADVTIDPACGNAFTATAQSFNPGESGTASIVVTANDDPLNCLNAISIPVSYNCPPNIVCPSAVTPSASSMDVCSGSAISLTATVDQGDVTYSWFDISGTPVNDPTNVILTNSDCAPIVAELIVQAVCDDDNSIVLTNSIQVNVYNDDLSGFVTALPGGCAADVTIDPSCSGILSSMSQTFNPGESGNASILVSVNDPSSCANDFNISVPYDCPANIVCPSAVTPVASSMDVCSGSSISLNAPVDQGDVTYSWFNIMGIPISDPSNVILTNSNCAPELVELIVQAVCNDDNSVVLTNSIQVNVYNDDLSGFVTALPGGCSANVSIDPSCNMILSSTAQNFNPGQSGTTNIQVTVNDPSGCAADFSLPVTYDCPANIVCPSTITASVSSTEICVGESFALSATVDQGNVVYTWTDNSGNAIGDPSDVSITHNDCGPMSHDFFVEAVCQDDNTVVLTSVVSVVIYIDDFTAFVSPSAGGCAASVIIDPDCTNFLSSTSQNFNPGESGTANILVSVNDPSGCATDFSIPVPYNCPANVVCPTSLTASSSSSTVCSGDDITLSASVDQGAVTYTWTNSLGNTVSPVLTLTTNGCQSSEQDFTVTAVCDDDNSVVFTETVTISVFPEDLSIFVSPNNGGCTADVFIDPSCSGMMTSIPQTFNPGQSGTANIQVTVNDPSACAGDFTIPVSYNCPQNIICPSSLTASSSLSSVCSDQPFALMASVDQGNVNYSWTDPAGNPIIDPNSHLEFITSCSPESFTYTVTATCVDDPSIILSETVVVIVNPTDVSAFITPLVGGCTASLSVDPSCNNLISASPQTFNPGESGTAIIAVTANDPSGCLVDFSVPVSYDCPATISCLTNLSISSSSSSVCNGESVSLTAVIDQGTANFIWFIDGTLITDPTDVTLNNNNCQPVIQTVTGTAICTTDNTVSLTETLDITVYPSDISNFVSPLAGGCVATVSVDPSCGNVIVVSSQSFAAGESGVAQIQVFYSNDPDCVNDFTVPVSYDCPEEPTCNDFTLSGSELSVCSGDVMTIAGDIDGSPLTASDFTLMANGQLVSGAGGVVLNNNNCQPASVTFIGSYICFDGSTITDTLEVLVYPNDPSSFVQAVAGTCTASVSISAQCGSYLSASNQTFNPGESGIAQILVTVNNGADCNSDFSVDVPYNCPINPVCPTTLTALTNPTSVCSSELFDLIAFVDQGNADITWSYLGTTLPAASSLSLTNLTCTPNTVDLEVNAVCESDTSIVLTQTVTVIVYPDDPSAYVMANTSSCTASVSIDPACGNYLSSTPQNFNPGESGTANINVAINSPNSCNSDFTIAVPYDCPTNPVCPTDIIPTLNSTQICSGDIFGLSATVDQGSATYEWSFQGNVFSNPNAISLSNLGCIPTQAELMVTATCDIDPSIILTETVTVTIYPDNVESFVTAVPGTCIASVNIDPACGNYLSSTPQNFNPGESGTASISVEIISPNSCNSDFTIAVPYNCPTDPLCPTNIIPTLSSTQVCSGEIFGLSATVDQGSAIFEWSYQGNVFSDPNAISLSNLGCIPTQAELMVTATCDIDPSIILTETVTVTIYPDNVESFVTAVPGTCTASVNIDPACGNYLSASSITFDPGQSGTVDIPVSILLANDCNSDFTVSVPYNCPIIQDCPSAFNVIVSSMEICSGDLINLETDLPLDEVSIEWMVPGAPDPIGADAFSSIVNNVNCQPTIFTFTAIATCDANPSVILTESVDVIVYPTDVSDFLTMSSGGCTASVSIDPACGGFLSSQDLTFMPGESGSVDITVNVNTINDCLSDFVVPVNYNCPLNMDCPGTVSVSASSSVLCSGESVDLMATIDQGMADFDWTDAQGNTINPMNILLSNSGCNPITETFQLVATCIDDPSITYTDNVSVLVFPSSYGNFISSETSSCSINVLIDPSCDPANFIYDNFPLQPGMSGNVTIPVEYANAPSCLEPVALSVDYNVPLINIDDVAVCAGSPGITISGISDSFSCSWTPTNGLSDPNSCNPTVSPNETTTYTILFTDANGCSFTEEFTYTIWEQTAAAGPDQTICGGGSAQLNASGGLTYAWSGGNLSCNDCPNPIATPVLSTTYTVIITDSNGCTVSEQVNVEVSNMLTVDAGPDITICEGGSAGLAGSGGSIFEWTVDGQVISNVSNPAVSPTTTTTYTLNASDGSCSGTDQVTVTVLPVPILILADVEICEGEALTLNLPSDISSYTLSWPGDNINLYSGDSFVPTYSGEYSLSTFLSGCVVNQTFDIILSDGLNLSLTAEQNSICAGESVELTVSGASSYIWMPSSSLNNDSTSTVIASPMTTTTYTVTGFSENCGMDQTSVTINVTESDFSNLTYDEFVSGCEGDTVRITAQGPYSFTWNGGDFVDSVSALALLIIDSEIDTVYLEATKTDGCSAVRAIAVLIDSDCDGGGSGPINPTYEISNAFTPNGDGQNDTWLLPFLANTDSHHVKIFNRWGELIYSEEDFSLGWDGMFNGEQLADGTYYYVIQYDENDSSITETGTITIVDGAE